MIISYNMKIRETPFYWSRLPEPVLPDIPFDVDTKTVERIKNDYGLNRDKKEYKS